MLQDLEYQIGRMLLQNSKMQVVDEAHKDNKILNVAKVVRGKKTEREIVKIEDSSDEPHIKKSKPSQKETKESSNDNKKVPMGSEVLKR